MSDKESPKNLILSPPDANVFWPSTDVFCQTNVSSPGANVFSPVADVSSPDTLWNLWFYFR